MKFKNYAVLLLFAFVADLLPVKRQRLFPKVPQKPLLNLRLGSLAQQYRQLLMKPLKK